MSTSSLRLTRGALLSITKGGHGLRTSENTMQRHASWKAAFQARFTRLYCVHSLTCVHHFTFATVQRQDAIMHWMTFHMRRQACCQQVGRLGCTMYFIGAGGAGALSFLGRRTPQQRRQRWVYWRPTSSFARICGLSRHCSFTRSRILSTTSLGRVGMLPRQSAKAQAALLNNLHTILWPT